jgi:hypothetical protein
MQVTNNIDSLISDLEKLKSGSKINRNLVINKSNKIFKDDPNFAAKIRKEILKYQQLSLPR